MVNSPQEPGYFVTGFDRLFLKYSREYFGVYWKTGDGYFNTLSHHAHSFFTSLFRKYVYRPLYRWGYRKLVWLAPKAYKHPRLLALAGLSMKKEKGVYVLVYKKRRPL